MFRKILSMATLVLVLSVSGTNSPKTDSTNEKYHSSLDDYVSSLPKFAGTCVIPIPDIRNPPPVTNGNMVASLVRLPANRFDKLVQVSKTVQLGNSEIIQLTQSGYASSLRWVGNKLLYSWTNGHQVSQIRISEADGSNLKILANDSQSYIIDFDVSPDQTKIIYSFSSKPENIFIMNLDGSQQKSIFYRPGAMIYEPVWSPLNDKIALMFVDGSAADDLKTNIATINLDGSEFALVTTSAGINYKKGPHYVDVQGFDIDSDLFSNISYESPQWVNQPKIGETLVFKARMYGGGSPKKDLILTPTGIQTC